MMTPYKLTLADDILVTKQDKYFNWLHKPSHNNMKRSDTLAMELRQLNPFLKPDALPMIAIDEEIIKSYDMFYLTDCYDANLIDGWNHVCRKHNVAFVLANCVGCFGSVFADLYKLQVCDKYYLSKKQQFYIENITNQKPGRVTLQKVGRVPFFEDGDYVTITGVQGMPQVNGNDPRPIKIIDPYTFTIESTLAYGKYQGGGTATYEKVPVTMNFASYRENMAKPRLGSGNDRHLTQLELHVCMLIYYELKDELEEDVCIVADQYTEEDLSQFISDIIVSRDIIKQLIVNHKLVAKKLKQFVLKLINMRSSQFLPVSHLVSNFAAFQLICRAGKLQPLNQLLYYDISEYFSPTFLEAMGTAEVSAIDHYSTTFRNLAPGIIDHQSLK